MTAPAALVGVHPRPAPASSGRLARWAALVAVLALGGSASAAPVSLGFGIGADLPAVQVASELTIDRGDPLGFALTGPVLIGALRVEPQLAWTGLGRGYGVPPAGKQERCPGLMSCTSEAGEDGRLMASLAIGPAWSIGEKGRVWGGPWGGWTLRGAGEDWSLGASVGGEFFLADRFSFGLDVRAAYTSVEAGGSYTRTAVPVSRFGSEVYYDFDRGWTVDVDGLAAFRYYVK